jgi:hypothetical protein
VRTTLDGVTDVSSAQAALPKLQEVTAQINKTDSRSWAIVGRTAESYCRRDQSADAGCQSAVRQGVRFPALPEVLKPSVDTLKAKLTALGA